jgi:hypothetical protein
MCITAIREKTIEISRYDDPGIPPGDHKPYLP